MGDENTLPPSKKRAAGRELSRDNPGLDDDEDVSEQETGTFKKASDEVLAQRKIVKVRRQPASSAPSAPSFNPFAGICLVAPVPTTTTDESKKESQVQAQLEEEAVEENKKDKPDEETGETCNEKELEDETEKAANDGKERNLSEKEVEDKTEKAVNDGEERKLNENELEEKTEKAVNDSSADKLNGFEQATSEGTGTPVDKEKSETTGDKIDEPKASDGQVQTAEENTVNGDKKEDDIEKKDINNSVAGTEATAFSSFQQLSSSKNAFTGLVGTGFSSSAFGSPSGSGFSFGSKTDQPALPSFSFGASNNGSTPLFGTTGATENKSEGAAAFPSMNEVSVETGEENEETVFTADSALFEYSDGGWKERGKGEVKVNVSNSGDKKARLVMRGRGNYRLIMNAYLYADMKLAKMDKKGITFACVNSASEGKTGLATFALKFKDVAIVETFSATVAAHKGETGEPTVASKTPENSPKAAEE